MFWKQLLDEATYTVPVESGSLKNIEWKRYKNGLLTFFGEGAITDFMKEYTYLGMFDDEYTDHTLIWKSEPIHVRESLVSNVYIGDGITRIDDYAFYNCCIQNIRLPNTLTEIGKNALAGNSFHSLTLPNSLKIIKKGCLDDNLNLKHLCIPASVEKIDCIDGFMIDTIQVEDGNTCFKVVDGDLYSIDMKTLLWRPKSNLGNLLASPVNRRSSAQSFVQNSHEPYSSTKNGYYILEGGTILMFRELRVYRLTDAGWKKDPSLLSLRYNDNTVHLSKIPHDKVLELQLNEKKIIP